MADTNIGFWEEILRNPTPAFQELISAERQYLIEKIPTGSKVLDIGCGDGRNIRTVLQKTKLVVGIDNDKAAVDDTRQSFLDSAGVEIIKAEANALPFEDKTFDVVVLFDILQNLGSIKGDVLTEAKRVAKDEGIILLCAYSEDAFEERIKMYNIINLPIEKIEGTKVFVDESGGAHISEQFSLDEIRSLASDAGLKIVDQKKIPKLAYICTLKKP